MSKTCFVVMGFGKKTDFETGRTLDLDMSYHNMIKPAVEAAGLECIRADEILHSGQIDVPMYEQLLKADVVIADLSTSNKNAFYELGIRHALRPYTTIIICEDGMQALPFDTNHIAIRRYHHLGEDIGASEARRFSSLLSAAIEEIVKKTPPDDDSPVYTFIKNLRAPQVATAGISSTAAVTPVPAPATDPGNARTWSALMLEADKAQNAGNWLVAKSLLQTIRENFHTENDANGDHDVLHRLALVTYKAAVPDEPSALQEARDLLLLLKPGSSNNPETLGLWGAVHKRLWEIKKNPADLDESIKAYERGFYLRNDSYNGINFAFLLNVRATETPDVAEAITDFIRARRVRRSVLKICQEWLSANNLSDDISGSSSQTGKFLNNWYWVKATMAEAYAGLGDDQKSTKEFNEASDVVHEQWMTDTTSLQLKKLRELVSDSPLKYLKQETK